MVLGSVLRLTLLAISAFASRDNGDETNPLLTIADIASDHGYAVDTHSVTTDDGFILEAFRLPHRGPESKGVVVFLSGWLCQVTYFVVNTNADGAIPYHMVEEGYDVWMMNHRNKPFPNHIKYKATDYEIWNYTNEDMIYVDIPAVLNYVKVQEGGRKATLVGHSRGGFYTALFAADPRSKDLLNAAALIGGTDAPIPPRPGALSQFGAFARMASGSLPVEMKIIGESPIDDFVCHPCGPDGAHWPGCCGGIGPLVVADPHVRSSDADGGPSARLCRNALTGKNPQLCTEFVHLSTGGNGTQDAARMPMMFAFYPSYESNVTQNVAALPRLKVKDITVPVIVFAGEKDMLVPLPVAKLVTEELRLHGKLLEYVEIEGYGHVDEISAVDCGIRIGGRLSSLLPQVQ